LSDVSISGLTNGQVLAYNGGASAWKNETLDPGVENLEELKDVEINSPLDNQVLTYDSGDNKWKNQTIGSSGENPPRYISFNYKTNGNTTLGITVSPRQANLYYCSTNLYTSADHNVVQNEAPVEIFYSTVSSPNTVAGDF